MNGDEPYPKAEGLLETERWLKIAIDDRDVARLCLDAYEPKLGSGVYHGQQSAEKLMKSLLVLADRPFPKTPDLRALGVIVRAQYPDVADPIDATLSWTSWGFVYRYPGPEEYDEPTLDDLRGAIGIIDRLVAEVGLALSVSGST